tara:strand:+ start:218 stop:352 length:135 start_codon:yes stop_codon:yes gene_type:complete
MENLLMFIIGLIIFCAYMFTLLYNIYNANAEQSKINDNDPELKK